jgi:hypothetical protein
VCCEGPSIKKLTNFRGTNQPQNIFIDFFLRTFLGVSQESSKTRVKTKCKKSTSKFFSEKFSANRQKNRCQFFLDFSFVFLRFQVLLSDGSSKTLQKTFYKKNRVEKFLHNNRQTIQSRFFLDFVLSRFCAFLGDGSSHKNLNNQKPFWPLRNQPITPMPVNLFFEGPLVRCTWCLAVGSRYLFLLCVSYTAAW